MSPDIKKILIVEDSDLLHRMYDLIFLKYRSRGFELVHAYNGREGIEKLHEHPDTSLILLDINMPVMSGLEFLEQCRQEEAFRFVPIIIISTEGKQEDTLRGLKAGANAYLTKPFQPNDLVGLIDKLGPFQQPQQVHAGAH